ncbi:MAG TPA: hypothetical protein VFO29_09775 [Candidatus Rubrimentiphilum sp.]|nr:hypothetical protein [Candidatus Rubrimentiphilum sp.]
MRSIARAAAAAAGCLVLTLGGCYHGPGTDNPIQSQGAPLLPWGVLASPAERRQPSAGGIYPSMSHNTCCSTGKDLTISTHAPAGARHLYLDVYFPDFNAMYGLRQRRQTVTVSFGKARESVSVDQPGIRELKFRIPKDALVAGGKLRFAVHMSYAVVPKNVSGSPDWRPFSIVLLAVDTG